MTLLIINVHLRDVSEIFIDQNINSLDDFSYIK